MKTNKLVLNVFALATVGLFAGCASDNYNKGASTATALTKSSDMIAKGNSLIDESLANLNDLVTNLNPDLRKQFKKFNASVNDLASTAKDVSSKAEDMKSQGAAYFAKWDKESAKIQNEDIRSRSAARKNEVAGKFSQISQTYDETKTAFQPFISDLRDVQKYLATDLTAGGLSTIKDIVTKATQDAAPVKTSLANLSEQFKGLGLSMSPTVK